MFGFKGSRLRASGYSFFAKIRATFFGGSHNKDCSILGSILGSPYFGKLPYSFLPRAFGTVFKVSGIM